MGREEKPAGAGWFGLKTAAKALIMGLAVLLSAPQARGEEKPASSLKAVEFLAGYGTAQLAQAAHHRVQPGSILTS